MRVSHIWRSPLLVEPMDARHKVYRHLCRIRDAFPCFPSLSVTAQKQQGPTRVLFPTQETIQGTVFCRHGQWVRIAALVADTRTGLGYSLGRGSVEN